MVRLFNVHVPTPVIFLGILDMIIIYFSIAGGLALSYAPESVLFSPRRFRKMFPNSEVVIVPYEEHFAILGSGHQVATSILSWWTRLEPGRAGSSLPVAV